MDSTKYYNELGDMSIALSNMIGENKWGMNKRFKNRNEKEKYTDIGISKYLWYMGNEEIEEKNTGVVPYAIGRRDVFLKKGKVNHKLRNIITVVIGNDEKYKGKLAANIDGSYGMDGEYKEYHHIGFDIESNKIIKEIESYANSKNGEKIYWITGYGQGGSIANLVGAKLTDKVGENKVYCYTIESFATINANKIVNKNNFGRGRYKNIFNLENRDDLMIKLLDRDIGWFKYGRSVRGSAEKLKKEIVNIYGDNSRGSSGKVEYRGSTKVVSEIINGIKEKLKNHWNFG